MEFRNLSIQQQVSRKLGRASSVYNATTLENRRGLANPKYVVATARTIRQRVHTWVHGCRSIS